MGASDWTSAFEAEPANTDAVSLGAQKIREGKVAVREVLAVDHHLDPTGGSPAATDNGKHKVIQVLSEGASGDASPTVPSDATMGQIYTKVSAESGATNPELYYQSADGIVRLTRDGSAEGIPVNTQMVFYQAAAPVGWELISAHPNDTVLGVTDRVGASPAASLVGGATYKDADAPSGPLKYNWTMEGVPGHQLTIAEMPAHTHTGPFTSTGFTLDNVGGTHIPTSYPPVASSHSTDSTGGGGSDPSTAHEHRNTNWRPSISAVIICKKKAYSLE